MIRSRSVWSEGRLRLAVLGGATVVLCAVGAGPVHACVGDCNTDASVTVDELVTMVNIALGMQPVTACRPGDADIDGGITVNELVRAVTHSLNGCPSLSFEERRELAENTTSRYRELAAVLPAGEAGQRLTNELMATSGVEYAGTSADGTNWYTTVDGLMYAILPTPSGVELLARRTAHPSSPLRVDSAAPCIRVHNRKALILSPFERQQPSRRTTGDLVSLLSGALDEVLFVQNATPTDQSVTLDHFKVLNGFGTVVIQTHGGVSGVGPAFSSGVVATPELDAQYMEELRKQQLVTGWDLYDPTPRYTITPLWMERFYPERFDRTLFVLNGCNGLMDERLAHTILDAQTESMFWSWNETVEYFDSIDTAYDLLSHLSSEFNAGDAYSKTVTSGYGRYSYSTGSPARSWTTEFLASADGEGGLSFECRDCLDLAGDWSVAVKLTGSCCVAGSCTPLSADTSGTATLTQDGCTVCINPLPDIAVCGPVTADHLQLAGPLVKCVNGREISNQSNLAGPASRSEFHLTGSGSAVCEVQGFTVTCTVPAVSVDGTRL